VADTIIISVWPSGGSFASCARECAVGARQVHDHRLMPGLLQFLADVAKMMSVVPR
jgi:hypothetical protein